MAVSSRMPPFSNLKISILWKYKQMSQENQSRYPNSSFTVAIPIC